MEDIFAEYIRLRDEIDMLSDQLSKIHQENIKCQKGCSSCCMDYSIFPVEFDYIKKQISGLKLKPSEGATEKCIFLDNSVCTIYNHRPIICRTHGLPLLYFNTNTEEWELSACELNFQDFDDFDEKNTFPQDKYNSRLFLLNEKYIHSFHEKRYTRFDLLPIQSLKIKETEL